MKAAAWGVAHNVSRSLFYVSRCTFPPDGQQSTGAEDARGPSGRRLTFRTREAAQAKANALNGYSTGHCESNKRPGGCDAHNLRCNWPNCDRRPA